MAIDDPDFNKMWYFSTHSNIIKLDSYHKSNYNLALIITIFDKKECPFFRVRNPYFAVANQMKLFMSFYEL